MNNVGFLVGFIVVCLVMMGFLIKMIAKSVIKPGFGAFLLMLLLILAASSPNWLGV